MKVRKTYVPSFIFFTLVLALNLAYVQRSGTAQSVARVSVKPPSIVNPFLIPGGNFTINCSVSDVADLYTWQITLFFNPTILNCTGASYPVDHVFAGKTTVPVAPIIDNIVGSILYGCSLMGAPQGVSGNGTFCQIQFKIKSVGESDLNYSEPYGVDTYLLDYDMDIIPVETQNGYFSNKPAPLKYALTITATAGGTTDPLPNTYTYSEGTVTSVLAIADSGYSFDHWELDGANYTSNPINITMNKNRTILAVFTTGPPLPQYTLTITTTSGGTTDPAAGSYNYSEGAVVSVLAIPNAGYSFDHWELDGANYTSNPITLTVNANRTLHTAFVIAPETMIYVDPSEIIDTTLVPSSTFNVNVSISSVQNLRMCYLNFSYDTSVLGWTGVKVFRIENVTPAANAIMNDKDGYIYLNLTYPASVTVATPKALFIVTFHVEAFGASVLDLHDTLLLDEKNKPIPHGSIDGFFCNLVRDVSITNVVLSRDWAYAGWKLNITITAKNLGNLTETFDIEAYYDSKIIGATHVAGLSPGAKANVTITWNTSGVSEGNYTIKAVASKVPYEYNITNNVFVDGKVWIMENIHDVAVTNVAIPYGWAYVGWRLNITVTVQNIGSYTESFDVKLFYDSNLMYTYTVADLLSSQVLSFVYDWNTTGLLACINYTLTAEATPVPYEFNSTNNIYITYSALKMRLLGDLNGDGTVDMLDISIAGQALGAFPYEPRWNPAADVNQDRKIDLRDIAVIAHNFGKTC